MTTKDRLKEFLTLKGIGRNKFESKIGIATGYLSSKSLTITSEVIEKAAEEFPDLNIDWLITGKGVAVKPVQSVGDISNSTVSGVNVNGSEIHISSAEAYNTLLKIVNENQKAVEKFQEQIDRLISIIEKKL